MLQTMLFPFMQISKTFPYFYFFLPKKPHQYIFFCLLTCSFYLPFPSQSFLENNLKRYLVSLKQILFQLRGKFKADDHSHYQFTPRDLTRWLMSLKRFVSPNAEDYNTDDVIISWAYMACRFFQDKLIGEENKSQFMRYLDSSIRLNSGERVGNKLQDMFFTTFPSKASVGLSSEMPLFGKQMHPMSDETYQQIVERGIEMYERDNKELNLCLFPEVTVFDIRIPIKLRIL